MKQKMSITVDEETAKMVEKAVEECRFRNKSHAIEYSVLKFLNEKDDNKETEK